MSTGILKQGPVESFWSKLEYARQLAKGGKKADAGVLLQDIVSGLSADSPEMAVKRLVMLKRFSEAYGISCELDYAPSDCLDHSPDFLDDLVRPGLPGISLVTCCKNRNENLLKALPSWLARAEISEIVVVDWSSDHAVKESVDAAGFDDPRIRVVRIDGESRWILSYAFNVGFRVARFEKVLKVDADIVISDDFFQKNKLKMGRFIAGDWRVANEGQAYINGFFYAFKKDLIAVKGFNEYITTYGWDDDDIYSRLEGIGLTRECVDPETIYHLPHDDVQRLGVSPAAQRCAWEELLDDPKFKIRANRFTANVMPLWTQNKRWLPFRIESYRRDFIKAHRGSDPIHYVPDHIRSDAEIYAARELLSWRLGPRVFDLSKGGLRVLLESKKLDGLNKLDVELALSGVPREFRFSAQYLFIEFTEDCLDLDAEIFQSALRQVRAYVKASRLPVIGLATTKMASKLSAHVDHVLHPWVKSLINDIETLDLEAESAASRVVSGGNLIVKLTAEIAQRLSNVDQHVLNRNGPELLIAKPKMYIDAQHGLGNRLRAIASAAAIAKNTDRELVVIWQPDHHCDCRIHDITEYSGPVIEESFVTQAPRMGIAVHNYMEIEPGAEKDEPIDLDYDGSIYVRSAYVLNCSETSWGAENEFLRSLIPTPEVQGLIDSVKQPNEIGVHVRMEAGEGLDHNSYDSPMNWTKEGHSQLHYWRGMSHYERFMKHISGIGGAPSIFLAADRPEIYSEFKSAYGGRVAFLRRDVFDRSRRQIQFAMADAILLSRCNRLLGSTWSSFSELALRLSPNFKSIEMSGKDF
ncbi:galactosyltransferase-related protein [Natronospira bacteriovora]|uniref:Glycosyltransferase n=1 Tax=Natronospira bacteriovora TaxID=3069753 RepID=A0ABU0W7Z4_9GAMM|nr:galactosyltransferase-related protein [Natronospira sp. AB-CW4]MDQ2070149.1 glycosyltransferase [Natronospira sp. AB-CW4]